MLELLNQQIKAGKREFTGEFFQKLIASDGAAADYFGISVGISGNGTVIVIGAHNDDDRGSDTGSAYVFTRQANGSYFQTQKLTASDGSTYDYFGRSVIISGDGSVIVVGAYSDDDKGTDSGSVYIFTKQADGIYSQKQKLTASDGVAHDNFGYSLSISSDSSVIAVGAYCDDDKGINSGSAYIFTKQVNGSYLQTQKLTAPDGAESDYFGRSVSVSDDGSVIVVGAYCDDDKGFNSGSAYVFTKQVNGSYLQTQKLTASDGAGDDRLGYSVSTSGDGSAIVVGAYCDDDKGTDSGSAYVFTKQANGSYLQTQKLTASDGATTDYFGYSVTISSDGTVIVVGTIYDDDRGTNSGSVYIFTKQANGNYLQTQKLTPSANVPAAGMGNAVCISSENTVVAGAYAEAVNGNGSAGSVYVFK